MPKFYLLYQLAMMGTLDVLMPVVRDRSLAARVRGRARKHAIAIASDIAQRYNGALFQDTPDRLVLETSILPYYQLHKDFQRIVFVGCDWYTAGYARLFGHKKFWTIDPDADRATYGAPRHHVAPMRNVCAMLAGEQTDVILCNGVIGWGLNEVDEAEASFQAAFEALRPGGHLIVGFNDLPDRTPFSLADVAVLRQFETLFFEPLGLQEYRVEHELRHVYRFYRKPALNA